MLGDPVDSWACCETAAATVLRSIGGATTWAFAHGTTTGWRRPVPAMSPSTTTASTGCCRGSDLASASAPDAPVEPLVEASTIERRWVSPERAWASSSSTAVPDASAVAGEPSASRWATTTIAPLVSPGRTPTTLTSVRRPSAVCASVSLLDTENPSDASTVPTCVAIAASAGDPGRRFGNCFEIRFIAAYACPALNASGASVVVCGPC